jgi:hypothetical protein
MELGDRKKHQHEIVSKALSLGSLYFYFTAIAIDE